MGDRITKSFRNFYLIFPLVFYSIRFVYANSSYFDNQLKRISQSNYFEKARFLDLQHLFLELYCNKKIEAFLMSIVSMNLGSILVHIIIIGAHYQES